MALTINPNMMAAGAAPSLDATHQSRTSVVQQLSPGPGSADAAGAGNMGLRQIIRAEIRPLGSADAQTPASGVGAGAAPVAPEQQTGSLLNTTDAGVGSGQAATRLGALLRPPTSSAPQANAQPNVGMATSELPMMNISASSHQYAPDTNMSDTGQDSLQGMARMQAMVQNGMAALARSSGGSIASAGQNAGALLDTSDSNTGLVKDSLQAIIDQPAVSRNQPMMTAAQNMRANVMATRQLTGEELALLKG